MTVFFLNIYYKKYFDQGDIYKDLLYDVSPKKVYKVKKNMKKVISFISFLKWINVLKYLIVYSLDRRNIYTRKIIIKVKVSTA